MAKLLLITDKTFRNGINNIGDIVGVFSDEHEFSKDELDGFKIISTEGKTDEVRIALDQMKPDISAMSKSEKKQRVVTPKYEFKIIDETKTDIKDAATCSIIVKPIS